MDVCTEYRNLSLEKKTAKKKLICWGENKIEEKIIKFAHTYVR